ncbi:MAG TPA: methyltransferase [Burkholderiales bacterium]|nr:methyltransferase [Burkholderiales bacterium]
MNELAKPDALLREQLRGMIDGYRVAQVLYVAAELRIADLLKDGSKRASELAAATRVDPRALFRILRALASMGVLEHRDDERFALASLGTWLRSDTDESLRPWTLFSARMYRAWADILESVRTGEGGLGSGHGRHRWERLEESPDEARVFHDAMGANSAWLARAVLDAYDFSSSGNIIDVGGGNGTLIASILGAYTGLRGVVFDLPEAIRDAASRLEAAGLAGRYDLRTGSFFDTVPAGGDAYVLSRVLHDWDDGDTIRILQSARRAMMPGTTLLIIERLLDPDKPGVESTLSDLSMMLMNGGCERTSSEFETLLAAAGFKLARVVMTATPVQILEAVAI